MWYQGKHERGQSQSRLGQQISPEALAHQLWAQVGWLAMLQLPAWWYRFRHLADGRWDTDYATLWVEYAPFAA